MTESTQKPEKAQKWDVGASRTKYPAFGVSVQVDATGIYLTANIGRRFVYGLLQRTRPERSTDV